MEGTKSGEGGTGYTSCRSQTLCHEQINPIRISSPFMSLRRLRNKKPRNEKQPQSPILTNQPSPFGYILLVSDNRLHLFPCRLNICYFREIGAEEEREGGNEFAVEEVIY